MAEKIREALQRKKQLDLERAEALTILRIKQVKDRTGPSRSTIHAIIKKGKFPAQVLLCSYRAIRCIEHTQVNKLTDDLVQAIDLGIFTEDELAEIYVTRITQEILDRITARIHRTADPSGHDLD